MDDTIEKGCNPRKDGLQPFIPYYYIYDRVKITLSYTLGE